MPKSPISLLAASIVHVMRSTTEITGISDYLKFYKFLIVLNEEQITKLRKIAIGILSINSFSDEEINLLENKLTAVA